MADQLTLDRLEITPVAVIAGDLLRNRRTGRLTIIRGMLRKVFYWSQGELVMVATDEPAESLAQFAVARGVMTAEQAAQAFTATTAPRAARELHDSGVLSLAGRQALAREWLTSLFVPTFALDEGTAAFVLDEPLDAELRIFLPSTAAVVLEGIRSITNGLVLRRSLGDLKREIEPSTESRFAAQAVPLTEAEQKVADALKTRMPLEAFLKQFPNDSLLAARVVIGMLALGLFAAIDPEEERPIESGAADTQRDLELLAALGSSDTRSLHALALSKQLPSIDHYRLLDVTRAATRAQILLAAEKLRRSYDPAGYSPLVRDAIAAIYRRIDESVSILQDSVRRAEYDKMLAEASTRGHDAVQQRIAQRSIAGRNYARARQLTAGGDFYGAIVLLRQAVNFAPDMTDAWILLGSCQERNPKWRRDAAESFQMALSIDPENVDALISLGDVYRVEGLISRAETCYEDALKIAPENQQARSRLTTLRKGGGGSMP